ncbi:hypothetical protein [Azospirillum sp.]|uniref:hypothetical protein n=1 Tax=Azospirillum sp. TaxID=34012 RepID=UPI002D2AA2F1|nr:hypothetical protein [Azospirillum sp.]HYF86772.1 hypothetical protein [Azospirillum sp.]
MNEASKQGKPENDTAKSGKPSTAGTDQDRDKTLTEKSEEKAGGANKKTPGPIYDV